MLKIFRSAYLFWSKQATYILKTFKILLLLVQFHNAPSKFCKLGLGGDRHWLSEPTICFRIMGKEICFHKIGPIMMPKKTRLHDFYDVFFFACVGDKMTDHMKCASIFRTCCVQYSAVMLRISA